MALTLRFRLLVLWLLTIAGCGSLGYVIRSVYLLGAEGQTERAVSLARDACSELQAEYGRAAVQTTDDPDDVLMSALLNVVLDDAPGVEGGFWHDALDSSPTPTRLIKAVNQNPISLRQSADA